MRCVYSRVSRSLDVDAVRHPDREMASGLFAESAERRQASQESDLRPEDSGRHPGRQSPEGITILKCLKRARRWRVPPHWSRRDWADEIRAEVLAAAALASKEFD